MGPGCRRLLLLAAACLAALAVTGTASASQSCGSRVLTDWRDGRLDGTYPVACYRQALAQLPEDVRVYSSAQADITRALQQRLAPASGPRADRVSAGGKGVSPMLVVAITVGLLAAAGSVAAALR
jgi:hypothetical protein